MQENISLILQTHEHLSRNKAYQRVDKALTSLHIEHLALLRYEVCSAKEIFLVQLIRACIQKSARIIIEQPFMFLNDEINLNFLFDALDALDVSWERIRIIDLKHQENYYEEDRCHIIK